MFTKSQVNQFDTFGFIVLRGVLGSDDLETINSEFETGLAAESEVHRKGIRKQLNWSNLGPETPFLASLLEDPRFLGPAETLLGEDVVGSFCNSNSFSGDRTEWHPDVSRPHWRGIKFGSYLQSQAENTGALRFIPGSHKEPLHSDMKRVTLKDSNLGEGDGLGLSVEEIPAYVAKSDPGDVIIFDNRTWHASWGGSEDRRMCTVGYFASPKTPEEDDAVRLQAQQEGHLRQAFPRLGHHPHWIANTDGSPRRQLWIDFLRLNGFI